MNASRYARTGGALGHLLLVVVLALGVLVMHTLGHPHTSSESGMGTASHTSASVHDVATAHSSTALKDAPVMASTGSTVLSTDGKTHGAAAAHASSSYSAEHPAMPMDVMSLCVAILLSAWVLAAMLRAALGRRPHWLANLLSQAPVAQRPNPPPRGPDLTQLSVLRL